ncbi:outer membrane beta-barrel protein [Planctomycetota bacterium]
MKQYVTHSSILLLALASLASAYNATPDTTVEITPFAGYGFGGDFEVITTGEKLSVEEGGVYGLTIDWGATPETQYELFFSHQATKLTSSGGFATPAEALTDLDITYAHIGGLLNFGEDKVKPFFGGGLGLTHFNLKNYSNETKFSINLGGGVKLFLTKNIGLRFEGRGLATLVNNTTWIHSGNGGATIGIAGDVIWQFMLNAGLIIAF